MVSSTTAASTGGSKAQADRLGPKVSGRPALKLHSSNEPGELSQWQCQDDRTMNIVVAITITINLSIDLLVAHSMLRCNANQCRCMSWAAAAVCDARTARRNDVSRSSTSWTQRDQTQFLAHWSTWALCSAGWTSELMDANSDNDIKTHITHTGTDKLKHFISCNKKQVTRKKPAGWTTKIHQHENYDIQKCANVCTKFCSFV